MAKRPRNHDGFAYDLGPEFELYKPGNQSLDFVTARIVYTSARDDSPLPTFQRLALTANDALNRFGPEIGVDGCFFVSAAGIGLENPFSPATYSQGGPQMFFAPYVRTTSEREAWANATVVEKMKLSSLMWKSQRLSSFRPVLPLWTPSAHVLHNLATMPYVRLTVFPAPKVAEETGIPDPTREPSGYTAGAMIDILENRIVFALADDYRAHCYPRWNAGGRSYEEMFLAVQNSKSHEDWARSQMLPGEDQIVAFIKAASDMCNNSPQLLVTYQRARAWAPTAAFHATVDPAKARIRPIHSHEPNPLMRAWLSKVPIHADTARRWSAPGHSRWSTHEDEIIRLITKGHTARQVLPYLPLYRTYEELIKRMGQLGISDQGRG